MFTYLSLRIHRLNCLLLARKFMKPSYVFSAAVLTATTAWDAGAQASGPLFRRDNIDTTAPAAPPIPELPTSARIAELAAENPSDLVIQAQTWVSGLVDLSAYAADRSGRAIELTRDLKWYSRRKKLTAARDAHRAARDEHGHDETAPTSVRERALRGVALRVFRALGEVNIAVEGTRGMAQPVHTASVRVSEMAFPAHRAGLAHGVAVRYLNGMGSTPWRERARHPWLTQARLRTMKNLGAAAEASTQEVVTRAALAQKAFGSTPR